MIRAACFVAAIVCCIVRPSPAADEDKSPTAISATARKFPPTHANVKYGPHARNVMDVWLVPSDKPTPVLVSIHGGGFYTGLKNVNPELLDECLKSGISVVAIAYRYSTEAIAPAPLLDGARAVQFIRSHAKEWNIDRSRFASIGSSAGGALSLWLALHDDLADPASTDPIARESTRMTCAIAINGQTTYDPRAVRKLFPELDVTKHQAVWRLIGVEHKDIANLTPVQETLYEESSAAPRASKDDPPVLLIYDRAMDVPITTLSIGIHHPRFGAMLKEKLDTLGVSCGLRLPGQDHPTPIEFLRKAFNLNQPTTKP